MFIANVCEETNCYSFKLFALLVFIKLHFRNCFPQGNSAENYRFYTDIYDLHPKPYIFFSFKIRY